MKHLKTLMSCLLVLIVFGSNKSHANTTVDIDVLASKIVETQEGKDLIENGLKLWIYKFENQLKYSGEKEVLKNNRLAELQNDLMKGNLTKSEEDEIVGLLGFENISQMTEMHNNIKVNINTLKQSFPEMKNLSENENQILFQSIFSKSYEVLYVANSCLLTAFKNLGTCVGISSTASLVVFAGCMVTATAGEEWVTEGTITAIIIQALSLDATVCRWLVGVGGGAINGACIEAAIEAIHACF